MRKIISKITTLMITVGLALLASNAVGQITMRFPVTRDVGIWTFPGEQMTSSGKQAYLRPLKLFENGAIMDFDTGAMGAFLQANPGTAAWTFNVFNSDSNNSGLPINEDIGIDTVESTNDWVEGDSNGIGQFTWTDGTAAATFFYAQTFRTEEMVDVGQSLQWIDPDSGPYTFNPSFPDDPANYGIPGTQDEWNLNPTPEFTNSASFSAVDVSAAGENNANIGGAPITVAIDDNIINALITDENNRGLRFGPMFNFQFTNWKLWGEDVATDPNGPVDPALAPYLEVTIIPEPGGPGDFDGDSDVDGKDFLLWQKGGSPNGITAGDLNEWGTNFGTASVASLTSVPEPTTGLLLLIGACGILGRRRG